MKNFIEQARAYAAHHNEPINKYTHYVGVPILILSLMIFFSFFHIGIVNVISIDFATIGTLALIIYYFVLNWKLAIPLTVILIFLLWIANLFAYAGPTSTALWAFIITFILGWGLLFVGHAVEKKRPAFMEHALEALIAPMFLTAEAFFAINWLPELKKEIYKKESKK